MEGVKKNPSNLRRMHAMVPLPPLGRYKAEQKSKLQRIH